MSFRITENHFALRDEQLPPVDESLLYERVVGSTGTFVRSRKDGLEACVPVALYRMHGLKPVEPYVQWGYPKVPAPLVDLMLQVSRVRSRTVLKEALFHLSFGDAHFKNCIEPAFGPSSPSRGWHLECPDQHATDEEVRPLHQGQGSSEARAIIEVHSHHAGEARFSEKDDADEGGPTFRIYAILGTIFERPTIRARVGLFGHFMEYPAGEFFELPEGLTDCLLQEQS